jgi:TPP-dependent pyruvate/acetoin dehydrogenase alpha subunit
MLQKIRNYILVALAVGAFYFLLSHHIVFTSHRDFNLLNKSELSLKYTFFSMKQQSPERILRIVELREAGIEDLLLEKGLVSEERLDKILDDIAAQEEE